MHKKKTSRTFSSESIRDVFLFYKKYSPINTPVLLSSLKLNPVFFLDHFAEDMHRQVQFGTEFCKGRCAVLLFYVIQCGHGNHIFVLVGYPHLHILNRFQKIKKDQSHSRLVDPVLISVSCYQRIDHIFQKILYL